MDTYVVVLRAVHIVAGAFWVGASLAFALFIEPTARTLGRSAGPFMSELTERRKLPVAIALVSVLAIVAGALLYWRASSGLESSWVTTPGGATYTAGALAAVTAWLIGFVVLRPGIARVAALAASDTTDGRAELDRLGRRLRTASLANASLLVVAALAMAIARYVHW